MERFLTSLPPNTSDQLSVRHSRPLGAIEVIIANITIVYRWCQLRGQGCISSNCTYCGSLIERTPVTGYCTYIFRETGQMKQRFACSYLCCLERRMYQIKYSTSAPVAASVGNQLDCSQNEKNPLTRQKLLRIKSFDHKLSMIFAYRYQSLLLALLSNYFELVYRLFKQFFRQPFIFMGYRKITFRNYHTYVF